MAGLKAHLEQVTTHFAPPYFPLERFVIAHGKVHTAQRLPPRYERGTMKQCFRNAALLALSKPRTLRYAEGIAFRIIPCHHAWCIDKAGNVVDPTWDDPEQVEYIGVEIPTKMLMAELNRTGYYGVLMTPTRGANIKFMERLAKPLA